MDEPLEFYVFSDETYNNYATYTYYPTFTTDVTKCERHESLEQAEKRLNHIQKHFKERLFILKITLTIDKEYCG